VTALDTPVGAEENPDRYVFDELFDQAELVRWRMTDIPWGAIDGSEVDEAMLAMVRQTLITELTTFTATQRFLDAFHDDVELSQWIAVWFYEETKHPQALARWLRHFDVEVPDAEVLAGRRTEPFMSSPAGTLAINVITEMTASRLYLLSAALSPEPVYAQIARNLGSDEARHASSFFRFARRALRTAARPRRERRAVLMVLLLWLEQPHRFGHPTTLATDWVTTAERDDGGKDFEARVCATFGQLLDLDIAGPADVRAELARLRGRKGVA
jgi:hypothetical protein